MVADKITFEAQNLKKYKNKNKTYFDNHKYKILNSKINLKHIMSEILNFTQ